MPKYLSDTVIPGTIKLGTILRFKKLSKEFQGNPLHILLSRLKEIKSTLRNWRNNKNSIHKVIIQLKEEASQIN
jgi:hypothetical protein